MKNYGATFMKNLSDDAQKNLSENQVKECACAEDVICALKPLIDEYFIGSSECNGDSITYSLPDGRAFRICAIAL